MNKLYDFCSLHLAEKYNNDCNSPEKIYLIRLFIPSVNFLQTDKLPVAVFILLMFT